MSVLSLVAVLAFVLGVAIQRGTTCAVLAVEELMRHRRADRFLGFLECGLWATLALRLLGDAGGGPLWSGWIMLLVGAATFGAGAAINSACAFGTIGRLGNGRLEYLLTAVGVFAAIRTITTMGWTVTPSIASTRDEGPWVGLILLSLTAIVILRWYLRRRTPRGFATLGIVMMVIGTTGAALGHLHQPWPWMKALGTLPAAEPVAAVALASMVAGAVANGLIQRRFRLSRPPITGLLARFGGGLLMGVGASLVPGGNDALILQGIPSGSAHAVVGYLTMLFAIALTLRLGQGISPPWRKASS